MLGDEREKACLWAQIDESSRYASVITPSGALRIVDAGSSALHSTLEGISADGGRIGDFRCACWLQVRAPACQIHLDQSERWHRAP